MTIRELFYKKKISVRIYNICVSNKFKSVKDLRVYYSEHYTFLNLPYCGKKSNSELIELCNMSDNEIKDKKPNYETRLTISEVKKNKSKTFRTNSIKALAEKYLEQIDKPVHVSIIKKHVSKYHPRATQKSILVNLRNEKNGTFVLFKGGHIGLTSKSFLYKKLDLTYLKKDVKKDVREIKKHNFEDLLQFIEKENRPPWTNTSSVIEKRLYRWFIIQNRMCKEGKLDTDKAKIIKDINDKYYKVRSSERANLFKRYDELIEFINTNNRLPLVSIEKEYTLYIFFYNRRRLFLGHKLHDVEKEKFEEVLRMVDAVK